MDRAARWFVVLALLTTVAAAGCNSPYHADRGALFGGLLGAGTGAIVGDALGDAGAGAAIGAGLGAFTGGVVGAEMDEVEARNRAMIEAKLGRQIAAGSVSIDDVLAMTHGGVDEELIVTHIRANGFSRRLQANDLIMLQQQGVSTRVITAMQEPPPPAQAAPVVIQQRAPVIIEEYHYGPPAYWPHGYHYWHHPRPRPRPGMSWGLSFHN